MFLELKIKLNLQYLIVKLICEGQYMINEGEEEEEFFPGTIKEALDLCLSVDFEFDLIHGLSNNKRD